MDNRTSSVRLPGWVPALAVLLACLPAYVVRIDRSPVRYHMEALTFVTSQETWLRFESGERDAWLRPTWNGDLRVNKPPMTVWVNFLAWAGLDAEDPVRALVLRARLAGAALTALALLSVYWIGRQLGGLRLAWSAALATGSMFLVIRQARLATYDTHLAGWVCLAVAAGLSALHAERLRGRALLAGGLASAALAAAILTKGPIALVLAVVPLAAIAWTLPDRRSALARALSITAVGVAVAAPWYLYLAAQEGNSASTLYAEYRAQRRVYQVPWYYLNVVGLVFPWSLWFAGGAVEAWRTRRQKPERFLLPILWLVTVIVILSVPGAKKERYLLPALPAAGLLAAAFWFADAPWSARALRRLRALHWGILGAASLALGLFLALQNWLVRRGTLGAPELPLGRPWLAVVAAAGLLALAMTGARLHAAGRLTAAFLCTFLWMEATATFVNRSYAASWHGVYDQLPDCVRVLAATGDAPLFYLRSDQEEDLQPDAKFLIYTRRVVRPVAPGGLAALAGARGAVFVMALDTPDKREIMLKAGFQPLFRFHDGKPAKWLYRGPSAPAPASPNP